LVTNSLVDLWIHSTYRHSTFYIITGRWVAVECWYSVDIRFNCLLQLKWS